MDDRVEPLAFALAGVDFDEVFAVKTLPDSLLATELGLNDFDPHT